MVGAKFQNTVHSSDAIAASLDVRRGGRICKKAHRLPLRGGRLPWGLQSTA